MEDYIDEEPGLNDEMTELEYTASMAVMCGIMALTLTVGTCWVAGKIKKHITW